MLNFRLFSFLARGSLKARLVRTGRLAVGDAVALGDELARALGRAHERGIVHRDVKPENILFADDGRALIADLGLAKHFLRASPGGRQSVSLSQSGDLIGSAGYMPLEQMNDTKSVGPPADVFALGAVLYECLAGVPAFPGGTRLAIMQRVSEHELEPLRHHCPGVPRGLEDVIARAMAPRPEERFADGWALARALVAEKPARGPRRRSRRSWLGVVVLCVAASSGAGVVFRLRASARAREVAALTGGAEALRRVERFADALALAKRAVELDPGCAPAWACLGLVHVSSKEDGAGFEAARRALELDDKNMLAWCVRGEARLALGQLDEAIVDLDRALALPPGEWRDRCFSARGSHRGPSHACC
jgi:hypothetical protein